MNVLKHIITFVIGLSIVWVGGKIFSPQPEEEAPSLSTPIRKAPSTSKSRRTPPSSANDYQEAWGELSRLNPKTPGYSQIQKVLIQDWLREDCVGALSILMQERETALLARSLIEPETIDANEEWIIAMLRDHRFGLRGRFLLDMLVAKRPNISAESKWKFVDLVDPSNQRTIFLTAFMDSEKREQWLAMVEGLSSASVRKRARRAYITQRMRSGTRSKESVANFISSINQMKNSEARFDMGEAIVSTTWNHSRPEKTIALLSSMEGEVYDGALDMAVSKLPNKHPTDDLRKNLNAYLEGGHFEAFNRIDDEFLRGWTFDDENMRDWAWNLPERSESARMIRGTVSRKFSRNPAAAQDWLANKSPCWQKDQAMVELARVADNPDLARWVLDEIETPALRTEAENFLQNR